MLLCRHFDQGSSDQQDSFPLGPLASCIPLPNLYLSVCGHVKVWGDQGSLGEPRGTLSSLQTTREGGSTASSWSGLVLLSRKGPCLADTDLMHWLGQVMSKDVVAMRCLLPLGNLPSASSCKMVIVLDEVRCMVF